MSGLLLVNFYTFENMRKSDKKLDNQLRLELTDVCEVALKDVPGFQWLTHLVNYDNFPASLRIVCVFDTNESLDNYLISRSNAQLQTMIAAKLNSLGVKLKRIEKHVLFDTEENCDAQHKGNWALRLK